jgi:hypothetical protein
VKEAAATLEGAILVVPLGGDPATAMHELGDRAVRAPALGTRPTYVRALIALVRRVEVDAGWVSVTGEP